MPDVTIHRCTLRVVRRGGWSWGPDPRGLAQHAARVLPELLEKALAGMFVDEGDEEQDREIAAPIRIRIPVRMSELSVGATSQHPSRPGATVSASLNQRVESALRAALGLACEPSTPTQTNGASSPMSSRFAEEPPLNRSAEGEALPRLLLAWHEHGVLERRLAMLPLEQIETWHGRLWSDSRRPVSPHPDAALLVQIEDFVAARAASSESTHRSAITLRRVLIAIEAAAKLSLPATHPSLWRTLDRLLTLEPSGPPIRIPAPAAVALPGIDPVPPPSIAIPTPASIKPNVTPTASTSSPRREDWSAKVDCALPFLLLAPLARLGYFAVLEAVLEAAGMSADAPLFAAALAYKVLAPPQRGWQRSPSSMLAAAALAGLQNPISEDSLTSFARRIASHTAALDIVLADALIAGHTPGAPVILLPGFLTLDAEGCFPISWADDPAPVLKRLAPSIVLIPPETADPALLRDLDAAGIVFVTEVRPTRNEHWQRIGASWTNSTAPPNEPLRRAARELTPAIEEARAFANELVTARTGIIHASSPEPVTGNISPARMLTHGGSTEPRPSGSGQAWKLPLLERSLTLAAAVALGMISWKLWRSRGRTTPHQVPERYADLEGRIHFDDASIHVNLPLGRRHQELRENGFLAPVAGIPWFGGRRVEFGGG